MKRVLTIVISALVLAALNVFAVASAHDATANANAETKFESRAAALHAKFHTRLDARRAKLVMKMAKKELRPLLNMGNGPAHVQGKVSGVETTATGGIIYLFRGFEEKLEVCAALQAKFKTASTMSPQDMVTMEGTKNDYYDKRNCDELTAQDITGAAIVGKEPRHLPRGEIVVETDKTVLTVIDENGARVGTLADFAAGDRVFVLIKKTDSAESKFAGLVVVKLPK